MAGHRSNGNNQPPSGGPSGDPARPPSGGGSSPGGNSGQGSAPQTVHVKVGSGGSISPIKNLPFIPMSPPGGYSLFGGTLHMAGSLQYQKWSKYNKMCKVTGGSGPGSKGTNGSSGSASRSYYNQKAGSGYKIRGASINACYTKKTNKYDLGIKANLWASKIASSGSSTAWGGSLDVVFQW